MREQNGLENQPDYSKYSGLQDVPPGWLQVIRGMDCSKFAMTAIAVIAVAAFQQNHEAGVITSIGWAAIAGVVLVLGVENVTRRKSNGETPQNPTENPPKPGNARGHQGKPRPA